jgi:putative flippase GtrA
MSNLIDKLPAPLSSRLRSRTGQQFSRFVLVAAAALAASEVALFIFGAMGLGGGTSGVCAGAVGALVSYVLSRWAWHRKGRPDIRRETVPFWLVSAGAWLILGLVTKLGHHIAGTVAPVQSAKWYVIVGAVYLVGNCLTFVVRFLIFHFLLFADRGAADGAAPGPVEEALSPIAASVATSELEDQQDRSRRH